MSDEEKILRFLFKFTSIQSGVQALFGYKRPYKRLTYEEFKVICLEQANKNEITG